ncbi:MAG: 6-pyruvoyl tetrahydropterin synthase family protein [Thermoanaerobaculia bacterium]
MSAILSIRLAKEDFKFSVAHFTIFDDSRAEPLHGHNYRMAIEIEGDDVGADEIGLLADCDRWKRAVRATCAALDDKVLLAAAHPGVAIETGGGSLVCRFAGREYRFPESEVLPLPLVNISMELLAGWVWHRLAPEAAGSRVRALAVEIEETPGQLCRYRRVISQDWTLRTDHPPAP